MTDVKTAHSLITCLLAGCSPATVTGFVIPVIVDAVNRATFWAPSHVGEKSAETLAPTYAHLYSSTSVVPIPVRPWIRASLNHAGPCEVLWPSLASSPVSTMLETGDTHSLTLQTAATLSLLVAAQKIPGHYRHIPAVTPTEPLCLTINTANRTFKDDQPAEALTNKVNSGEHAGEYTPQWQ